MPNTDLGQVSIVPKGEYAPNAQYERLDAVQYQGSGYLSLKKQAGVTPVDGADWMLLVAQGDRGVSGLLPVTHTADTTLTMEANTCTVVTGQPTVLNVTLGAPVSDTDTEWRMIFKAGEGFILTDTAPSGYAIQWESEPVWQVGTIYEVSYGNVFLAGADGSVVIGALWRSWT